MMAVQKNVSPRGGTFFILYKKRTGEAHASPGKLSNYLYLRFLAASDFFFLFTLGFS